MNHQALADYYARRAPEYERIYQKPERQPDLRRLRETIAEIVAGRRVLEVACGTGWWTEVMSASARSIAATDINEEVLAVARAKHLPDNVAFHHCDAFTLEQVDGEFDAALAAFWWSHLTGEDLARFLNGLHRRLKPGSVVVFIDNNFVSGSSTPISRRDSAGNTYQTRLLGDGSRREVLKNFPTEDEIRAVLEACERSLRIEQLPYYWLARYATP